MQSHSRSQIRHYAPEDEGALRGMVAALHDLLLPLDADLAPTGAMLDAHFADLMRQVDETQGAIFLLEASDAIVGYAVVFGRTYAHDLDEKREPFAYLAELYVEPTHRGQGLGAALLAEAEAYARGLGAHKLELNMLAKNTAARRFYEREGYGERVVTMVKRFT